ncbi:MAG: evbL [Mycobacteriales bacterium]
MTELTGQQTCDATKGLAYDTGAGFMTAAAVTEFGQQHGYADMHEFYLAGRCGVLGDVDADVVAAAFGFFEPAALRAIWEAALSVRPAREAAALYTQALTEQGSTVLAGLEKADELAALIERVVDAASPAGLPLFAGWRAAPRPSAPIARAVHAIHLLREWRGSAHVCAVAALALPPLDAIMLNGGAGYAEFYRWPEPWGDGGARQELSAHAERLTDGQCAPAFERALSPLERGTLAQLLQTVAEASSPTD